MKTVDFSAMKDGTREDEVLSRKAHDTAMLKTGLVKGLPPVNVAAE